MEEKETKYVELPPVRFTCYFCGKEHERTSMAETKSITPGHAAGFMEQFLCDCGAIISVGINIGKMIHNSQ